MTSRGAFDGALASDPEFIKLMLMVIGVNGTGRVVKVTDGGNDDHPYSVEFETEVPSYGGFSRKGKLTTPVGVNLQNILAIQALLKADSRRSSLMIGAQIFHEKYLLHIPPSVMLGTLPSPVTIDNAVGRFAVTFKRASDGVEVDRQLTIYKDTVAAQEYPMLRDLVQRSLEAEKNGVEYTSTSATSNTKQQQLGGDAFSVDNLYEKLLTSITDKPLTNKQALALEQVLRTHPDDFEAHRKLAAHYSNLGMKDTPVRTSARLSHRLWFVEHHPEVPDKLIFHGVPTVTKDSGEYQTLRDAWLKQIVANKSNSVVRLNAAEFIGENDTPLSIQILTEGMSLDPTNYEFPLRLTDHFDAELKDDAKTSTQHKELSEKVLANGEKALSLIKTERSGDRDHDRFALLKKLCSVAIDLGETAKARVFAQELILDFGPSPSSVGRASATHVGNITLGQAALAEGNLEKAKEYLLIAIRAPLRLSHDDIEPLDTKLAAALFAKGEKAPVVEYLKLCLEREAYKKYPSLYKLEVESIKSWLSLIDAGKTPSFELARLNV
jgi:tetratricopeptide (TPR) repeat protein